MRVTFVLQKWYLSGLKSEMTVIQKGLAKRTQRGPIVWHSTVYYSISFSPSLTNIIVALNITL